MEKLHGVKDYMHSAPLTGGVLVSIVLGKAFSVRIYKKL
jgi:hypothetical protein